MITDGQEEARREEGGRGPPRLMDESVASGCSSRCDGRWQETSPEIKSKIQLRWEDDRAKIEKQERRRFKQRVNGGERGKGGGGEGKEKKKKKKTKEENGWNGGGKWGGDFWKIGFWWEISGREGGNLRQFESRSKRFYLYTKRESLKESNEIETFDRFESN